MKKVNPLGVFSKPELKIRHRIAYAAKKEINSGNITISAVPVTKVSPLVVWSLTAFLRSAKSRITINKQMNEVTIRYVLLSAMPQIMAATNEKNRPKKTFFGVSFTNNECNMILLFKRIR